MSNTNRPYCVHRSRTAITLLASMWVYAGSFSLLLAQIQVVVRAQEVGLSADNRPDHANLVYDRTSGSVVLAGAEAATGEIISFALSVLDAQPSLRLDEVRFPFENTGRNTDIAEFQIGQFQDTAGPGFASHLFGRVLPAKLTKQQLVTFFDVAIYASDLGQGGNFDAVMLGELPPGDFTGDHVLDGTDIDLLCGQLTSGEAPMFDLTGDNVLDEEDLDEMLKLAGYLPGDADTDGTVAVRDFLRLADRFGGEGNFSDGDFNCNGTIDFSDFLVLASNFGNSSDAASVPEPNGSQCLVSLVAILHIVRIRRGHESRRFFSVATG